MIANYHSRARMASVVDAIIDRLRSLPAAKSISEIVREFTNLVERLVVDAANGNVRRASFTEQMRNAIIDDGKSVYLEGMREGGIKDPDGDFDDDDQQTLDDWILSQAPHIGSFVDDAMAVNELEGDARTVARDVMLARAGMWVGAFSELGNTGKLNAMGNPFLTFDGDDGKESCVDCMKYKGQRHRKKWWEDRDLLRRNGNENFACGRWVDKCNHGFRLDDGEYILE